MNLLSRRMFITSVIITLLIALTPDAASGDKKEKGKETQVIIRNYNTSCIDKLDLVNKSREKVGLPTIVVVVPEADYLPQIINKYRGPWDDVFIFPGGGFSLDTGFFNAWLKEMGCGGRLGYGSGGNEVAERMNENYNLIENITSIMPGYPLRSQQNQQQEKPMAPLQGYVLGELKKVFQNSNSYRLTNSDAYKPSFYLKSCIGISGTKFERNSYDGSNNRVIGLAEEIAGKKYKNDKVKNKVFDILKGVQKEKGQYLVTFYINLWIEDANNNVVLGSHGISIGLAQSCQRIKTPWGTEKVEGTQNTLLEEVVFEAIQQAIDDLQPASFEKIN